MGRLLLASGTELMARDRVLADIPVNVFNRSRAFRYAP